MTVFDKERQKRANEMKKKAEDTAREVTRSAKQRQADDARRKQESISQQYLEQSLFPELLRELKSYLDRPGEGVSARINQLIRQQFNNPSHEYYGAVGLTLEERSSKFMSSNHNWPPFGEPLSYKRVKWINVIALPNGTIKVEGSPFGKTTLSLDQWRDSRTGSPQKDVAERAIDKAWKFSHVTVEEKDTKMEYWDTQDWEAWKKRKWWQILW